jgi:hypothetical protein
MPVESWHRYLRQRLLLLAQETEARVVVFDGVFPYPGLLQARARLPETAFVWFRRGLWQPGVNMRALRSEPFFDLVIEPGDLASAFDGGATAQLHAVRVGPVTMLESERRLDRQEGARSLGLDPNRPSALVMLSDRALSKAAVRALLKEPSLQVVVARTDDAALMAESGGRVRILGSVYPLVGYLGAFDYAVAEAGYNSFHELLLTGTPTVFVPRETATDDQFARARWAAMEGMALVSDGDADELAQLCTELLRHSVRARLAAKTAALPPASGAADAADVILDLARRSGRHKQTVQERLRTAELTLRDMAWAGLGARRVASIRGLLNRPVPPGPTERLRLRPVDETLGAAVPPSPGPGDLVLTERAEPGLLNSPAVVEHLASGMSQSYREGRRRLARQAYDLDVAGIQANPGPSDRL